MLPSEVLLAARELVAGGWTKHALARDGYGMAVPLDDPEANCFCARGAIMLASIPDGANEYNYQVGDAEKYAWKAVGSRDMLCFVGWNNNKSTTHLDVVLAFERAALLAMSEGK